MDLDVRKLPGQYNALSAARPFVENIRIHNFHEECRSLAFILGLPCFLNLNHLSDFITLIYYNLCIYSQDTPE